MNRREAKSHDELAAELDQLAAAMRHRDQASAGAPRDLGKEREDALLELAKWIERQPGDITVEAAWQLFREAAGNDQTSPRAVTTQTLADGPTSRNEVGA